jgi:hypothetical protein
MHTHSLLLPLIAGTIASFSTPAAERLNVKTGLWEIKTISRTTGVLPLPRELLDKMTPEQQAKLRADMKAAQAGPSTDTSRECITEKDVEKPFSSANTENCKQSIVDTTRSSQEVRIECTGEPKGSGVLRISTPTSEAMTGTLDLTLGSGPDAFNMKAELQGRWLDSDCGDEAEEEPSEESSAEDDISSPQE